jgi:ABC-type transport system involved in cytochrome c biogenesis ATPase subunit/N-acetylglutamate synthase-like GNAT family acetyltransferase
MGKRQFEALKKSIQRWGFVVPIITNRDLLVADGEHRLRAAKELGMKQVSVVRLLVDEVDRRMIRQVMNKIRGEHDLFLDAEEYSWLVSEGSRDLLKGLLNENDLRIDNLLKLLEPATYVDDGLKAISGQFATRVESNRLDGDLAKRNLGEPLTLKCHAEFSTKAEVTERTLAVCEAFGLGVDEAKRFVVFDDFSLEFRRGDLVYVTGDSGGGKTLLLKAFRNYFADEAVELSDLQVDPEETLIEGVGKDVKEAIEILSLCGLNDAFLFLRRFKELSDGQKYRYKLAKLVNRAEKTVWVVDEFCASLDRVMARVVAFLFQKVARKLGKTVVVATTHDDLIGDFQPDIVVRKGFEGDVEVVRNEVERKPCSICTDVRIEKGSIEDYEKLKRFHYRSKNEKELASLRMKDCYKLLYGNSLIGVIVYSHSYLNLKPRNMVFGERYVFTPGDLHKARLINDEIARISRVVIHPKFRGIGLGAFLVKETLHKVDAKVVEVLAVMARYNPFFEKAGMLRVDYRRDETGLDCKIKRFLEEHSFDFKLAKSKAYCREFFNQLNGDGRRALLAYLVEFARQPFVKMKTASLDLISKVLSSDGVYLYWIKSSSNAA